MNLFISLNKVFGDIMVLASPPRPPVDPDDVNTLTQKIFNLTLFFFRVMLGPYIKFRGTRGTEMSANTALITMETYVLVTRGNNLKTSFSYRSQNVKKKIILGYLGGPEGVFNDQTGPILLSSYPLTHISMYMSNKETIWQEIFKFKSKIWPKYTFFSYLGGGGGSWGALVSNPGERKFQGSKTSSQSRHMYNKRKK